MDGILKLNAHSIRECQVLGSHDPSMMWDEKSQKYYSYSTDVYMPEYGLCDRIGIPVRSSDDLIHFKYEGIVLSEQAVCQAKDNGVFPDTVNFWAPYVESVGDKYRMYYSATREFGSWESRIWVAESKSPLGPFENTGIAADSWGTNAGSPNAIDPHILRKDTRCWLVYGSFFGGIYIKELDAASGLPKEQKVRNPGICISKKPNGAEVDGPEGAAVIYVAEEKYYYLFQSYGWLGDTYDIRVGRSRNPEGPYLDYQGKNLNGETLGTKLAGSYTFSAEHPNVFWESDWQWGGFRGPGHGVPFYDSVKKSMFFVHHVRDGAQKFCIHDEQEKRDSYSMHYMMVREMYFVNGWPAINPQPYTGEINEPVSAEELEGEWEILIWNEENEMKHAITRRLGRDSEWFQNAVVRRSRDFENAKETVTITGFLNSGLAFWGKLMYSNI